MYHQHRSYADAITGGRYADRPDSPSTADLRRATPGTLSFVSHALGGMLGLPKGDPLKKSERRARAVPFMVAILVCWGNNNQPNIGVIGGGGIEEGVRPWRDVGRRRDDVGLAIKIFDKN